MKKCNFLTEILPPPDIHLTKPLTSPRAALILRTSNTPKKQVSLSSLAPTLHIPKVSKYDGLYTPYMRQNTKLALLSS